jgi:RNA polymerase sigma-70 factor (ECF subfamily)
VVLTLPWLRRVLANNLTDEVRKLHADKRDVRRERRLVQGIEQSSLYLEAMLVDNSPTPSENVARQEQVLNLSLALQRLPDTQRKALVLQIWQGRSLAEIAEQMGKTPQAVAGLLKRGLRQLRLELNGSEDQQNASSN